MQLKKIKIGELISLYNEKNSNNEDYPFYGININKEFMPSLANTSNVDRSKYKIVKKGVFVFSGMQTGRDNCIRIAMYDDDRIVLVSPAYTTFIISSKEILPEYLFMIFRSKEKDRFGAFLSDSSVRANLDWEVFCEIELEVPSIEIQNKYVEIYNGLIDNLKSYERGLSDLKLVCDSYIEKLRREFGTKQIGPYIEQISNKNSELKIKNVLGISKEGFISPKQTPGDLEKYVIFKNNYFVYNHSRINVGSIGLYKGEEPAVCSPIYVVFKVKDESTLNPEYLMLWLSRSEFLRSTDFYSIASVRNNFSYELMEETKIAFVDIKIQNEIVAISQCINERKDYINSLKKKIAEICPILVRGAVKEVKGGN